MKISFDFDSTLDRESVQKLAKQIIAMGHEVYIVTSRWDDKNATIHYHQSDVNADLYKVAEELGIPKERIIFTNMIWKAEYFMNNPDFLFHLDDNLTEIKEIHKHTKIIPVSCWANSGWYPKCLKLATKNIGK